MQFNFKSKFTELFTLRNSGLLLIASLLLLSTFEYFIDVLVGNGDGKISSRYFIAFLNVWFTLSVIGGIFLICRFFFSGWLANFLSVRIDTSLLSVFRILYGVIVFSLCAQNTEALRFIYYESDVQLNRMFFLNGVSLITSIFITFGAGGKIPLIINILLLPFLLHGDVGREQLKIAGFWMLFMNLNKYYSIDAMLHQKFGWSWFKQSTSIFRWPVYLMVINLSITIFHAGISKSFDPLWIDGYGFYYTFLNHWLKHSVFFDFITNNKLFMLVMNYGTIFSELIVLPFLLFRRTIPFAIVSLVAMYSILTFIFRIDPIGPSGLLITFAAITLLPRFRYVGQEIKDNFKTVSIRMTMVSFLITFLLIQTLTVSYLEVANGRLRYPKVSYPFSINRPSQASFLYRDQFNLFEEVLNSFSKHRLILAWYEPFNFHHFLGRGIFRIVGETNKGQLVDISKIFNEDGTTNFNGPGGGILQPRVIQDKLTHIQYINARISFHGSASVAEPKIKIMQSLIWYFYKKSHSQAAFKKVHLMVKSFLTPADFTENFDSIGSSNWVSIYCYDVALAKYNFSGVSPKSDFSHLSNEWFRLGKIIYSP